MTVRRHMVLPERHGGIWVNIRIRFGPRLAEWMLAFITAGWGYIALLPGDLFAQPAYAGFRVIFGNERALGWVMLCLGVLRLIGLVVNGSARTSHPGYG